MQDCDGEQAPVPAWGYLLDGIFRPIPWEPLKRAGFRNAPFDVTMPDGQTRHVIEEPMSGNQPIDDPPEGAAFPTVGQYEVIPGPGDDGYVAPPSLPPNDPPDAAGSEAEEAESNGFEDDTPENGFADEDGGGAASDFDEDTDAADGDGIF